jgi:hypothetical protein
VTVLLLVTWLHVDNPSPSYTATFNSLETCQQARAQLFDELKRLRDDYEQHWKRMGRNYNPGPPPNLTAVCAPQ